MEASKIIWEPDLWASLVSSARGPCWARFTFRCAFPGGLQTGGLPGLGFRGFRPGGLQTGGLGGFRGGVCKGLEGLEGLGLEGLREGLGLPGVCKPGASRGLGFRGFKGGFGFRGFKGGFGFRGFKGGFGFRGRAEGGFAGVGAGGSGSLAGWATPRVLVPEVWVEGLVVQVPGCNLPRSPGTFASPRKWSDGARPQQPDLLARMHHSANA